MLTRLFALLLAACLAAVLAPAEARAANCTASVSDLDFGTVTLRAGASNQTQGTVTVRCSNPLLDAVGVCLRFGPGSGGAGGGNSPRYLRNATGKSLAYELRAGGPSAVNGTLNEVYLLVPIVLGIGGEVSFPIYGQIVANAPSVPTGSYQSNFTGAGNIQLSYGVLSCDLLGQQATPPAFAVRANVEASCEIDVTDMNFGAIDRQITAPIDQTATLNVRCSDSAPYTVTLGQGQNGGSDPARRRMRNGDSFLEYGLYQNAGRSSVWGSTPATGLAGSGAGLNQSYRIHGRIHPGQTASFGAYSDSVVVTVNY